MWRKILKVRALARTFHKVDVRCGENTSFWFDIWPDLGCLHDKLGARGVIYLGILLNASVPSAWTNRRRRRHQSDTLRQIEVVLEAQRQKSVQGILDVSLWRSKGDKFNTSFSSKNTWFLIRLASPLVLRYKGI
ncbi:hypothetical protein V5N11_013622 [Cardamine amara subsp. amara]|uniref:Uncharacterized protein n=1 Tax=Cardamine amara subsp. amara TaxID=228776 RepID=A0ABD1A4I6_CARAN